MGKKNIGRFFKDNKKTAFISYVTAGDPNYKECLNIIDILIENGVDIIELGIPFSDPLADGEVNQLSAQRALQSGMTPKKCLELVRDIRKKHSNIPIVFYTYLNLVAYARDFREFCLEASNAGLDALLLLDLTPEESVEYKTIADEFDIGIVALVAPNTKEERISKIAEYASSFIYYVSQEGVTGIRKAFAKNVDEKINLIKKYTTLPVVVGFGISSPEQVKTAAKSGVDGVVVGSAIVKKIQCLSENDFTKAELSNFIKSLTSEL